MREPTKQEIKVCLLDRFLEIVSTLAKVNEAIFIRQGIYYVKNNKGKGSLPGPLQIKDLSPETHSSEVLENKIVIEDTPRASLQIEDLSPETYKAKMLGDEIVISGESIKITDNQKRSSLIIPNGISDGLEVMAFSRVSSIVEKLFPTKIDQDKVLLGDALILAAVLFLNPSISEGHPCYDYWLSLIRDEDFMSAALFQQKVTDYQNELLEDISQSVSLYGDEALFQVEPASIKISEKFSQVIKQVRAATLLSTYKSTSNAFVSVVTSLLIPLFFTLLGFAVFRSGMGFNFIAGTTGFFPSPLIIFSLIGFSLTFLIYSFSKLKVSAIDIPACQAMALALEAKKILEDWSELEQDRKNKGVPLSLEEEKRLAATLVTSVSYAERLLEVYPLGAMREYATAEFDDSSQISQKEKVRQDYRFLRLLVTDTEKISNNKPRLLAIFQRIASAKIDSHFTSSYPLKWKIFWFSLYAICLTSCVALLSYTFKAGIQVSQSFAGGITGPILFAGVLGFGAWRSAKYFLRKTPHEPYTKWALVFSGGFFISAPLSVVLLLVNSSLPVFISASVIAVVFALLSGTFGILAYRKDWYFSGLDAEERIYAEQTSKKVVLIGERFLLGLQIVFIPVFSFLAFLSMAMIFQSGGLNLFDGVITFVTNIVDVSWMNALPIPIFAASGTIVFELLKSILQIAPNSADELKRQQKRANIAVAFFKGVAVLSVILFLIVNRSIFIANGSMPMALTLTAIMFLPLISVETPFKKFNKWFSENFSWIYFALNLKPLAGDGKEKYLLYVLKELFICALLAMVPFILRDVSSPWAVVFFSAAVANAIFRIMIVVRNESDSALLAQVRLQDLEKEKVKSVRSESCLAELAVPNADLGSQSVCGSSSSSSSSSIDSPENSVVAAIFMDATASQPANDRDSLTVYSSQNKENRDSDPGLGQSIAQSESKPVSRDPSPASHSSEEKNSDAEFLSSIERRHSGSDSDPGSSDSLDKPSHSRASSVPDGTGSDDAKLSTSKKNVGKRGSFFSQFSTGSTGSTSSTEGLFAKNLHGGKEEEATQNQDYLAQGEMLSQTVP